MAIETFQDRLKHAIKSLPDEGSFDEKLMVLHAQIKAEGVTGVHGTRRTLRRWVEGRGTPPPYWVEMAAGFLGVNVRWLRTGDGVMMAKGRKQPSAPPKGVERAAKPEKVVDPRTDRQKRREAQQKALARTRAAKAAKEEPPQKVEPEATVNIPSKEDVWATKAPQIYNFLEKTESAEAVQSILKHEPGNPTPRFRGGRKGIIKAGEAKLKELQPDGGEEEGDNA